VGSKFLYPRARGKYLFSHLLPNIWGQNFEKINDLGQDFGNLNNKIFYKGLETPLNRGIY